MEDLELYAPILREEWEEMVNENWEEIISELQRELKEEKDSDWFISSEETYNWMEV